MKKIYLFLSATLICATASLAQKSKIVGHLTIKDPIQKVFLIYRNGDENINDSTIIKNGYFTFTENISEPTLARLVVQFEQKEGEKRPRTDALQLFIEQGVIRIEAKDTVKNAKISGSKSQKAFDAFSELLKPYNERGQVLNKQYRAYLQAKDEVGVEKIRIESDKLKKEKDEKLYLAYLKENPSSPIALYTLGLFAGYEIDPVKIEPLFNSLSKSSKNSISGTAFKNRIETAKKTAVGAYAMNFTQNDTLGKPISLSDFKGKYVLLDFWASWCGPCRAENPNVVKAFNQYKDKNFTVLGVSLDQDGKHQAWMDAIHKDELTWTHVSDLKFWDNAVAKQFGIRAIPQNLLIDPNGKIIAKNIRGEELNKKLEEVIK